MADGMIGEVKLFAGDFEPPGWLICDGRELRIDEHVALFSVIGTRYGGDGVRRFRLPDLRGRVALGAGTGPGLSARALGETPGAETVRLEVAHLPPHRHPLRTTAGVGVYPGGDRLALGDGAGTTGSSTTAVADTGGGQAHDNLQPSLVLHHIICVAGTLPPDPARAGPVDFE